MLTRAHIGTVVIIALASCALPSVANLRMPELTYVVASGWSNRYLKVFGGHSGQRFGVAYEVSTTGPDVELWRVSGWYEYPGHLFLSRDGYHLARIVDVEPRPPIGQLKALEFYSGGRLVRSYKVTDLVSEEFAETQIKRGKAWWYDSRRPPKVAFVKGRERLELETWNRRKFVFNLITGEVIERPMSLWDQLTSRLSRRSPRIAASSKRLLTRRGSRGSPARR